MPSPKPLALFHVITSLLMRWGCMCCVCSQSLHMPAVWPIHLCWLAIWNPKQKRKLFSALPQHSFWSFSSTQQLVFMKCMRSYELWVVCQFWLKLGKGFKNYWGRGGGEDTGRQKDRPADGQTDSAIFLGSQAKDSSGSVACLSFSTL